tara:strand:+ start:1115 stop:2464 length:1350 start_codon:yes stop_codon:yes gene_type:complete
MKKIYTLLLLIAFGNAPIVNAQKVLGSFDFESGYTSETEIQSTDSSWATFGEGFTFPAKNTSAAGAETSDWYARMEATEFAYVERVYELIAGETYVFKASVLPDAVGQKNAYTLRIIDEDASTPIKAESAPPSQGSAWEELTVSYIAEETKNYKFRFNKNWGNQGVSFDNFLVECTACTTVTVNFTADEGFTNGALYTQSGWDSSFTNTTWVVDTSIEAITLSNNWQRAAWGQGFSVSGAGESITFRVDLKFIGTFGTNNNPLIKIGFSSSSDVRGSTPSANVVFLRTASYNTQFQLGNNVNSGPLSPNASLLIADCQATAESDDLAVFVTLTLGADAASSTISAKLMNLTDGTETVIGSYTGINSNVFSAATTNIYGFLHAQTLTTTGDNAVTQVQISSVKMTQGDYLYSVVNRFGSSTSSSSNRINSHGQIGAGNTFVNKNGKTISY